MNDESTLNRDGNLTVAVVEGQLIREGGGSETAFSVSHSVWRLYCKRLFDIVLSALVLLLVSPLMFLIVVLIKLDSEGPVFYTQLRVGQNKRRVNQDRRQKISSEYPRRYPDKHRVSVYEGALRSFYFLERRRVSVPGKPFKIYKFRSMYKNAEANGRAVWSTQNDPRITRVGSLLRKTHLDELPQLINVLRGDMSWVGPRPERPTFVGELSKQIPGYGKRLVLKPGLTGPAQICRKPDVKIDDVRKKIRYDWLYVKKVSLQRDINIILGTVPFMFGIDAERMRRLNKALRQTSRRIPISLFPR